MKGRKPIPSKIIELRGGRRHTHRPMNALEPRPPERAPSCPRHLDAVARKEWRRLAKILGGIGLLTELDRAVLAGHCQSWSEYIAALEMVRKSGTVYKRANGDPALSPYLRVMREAFERWLVTAASLGLHPASRSMLKVERPKEAGKVEAFMSRKNEGQP